MKDLEEAFESKSHNQLLQDKIEKLEKENMELKKTLEEYGIDETSPITDVEYICIKSIESLKTLAENGVPLSESDTKVLDVLHKNLRLARGQMEKKEPKGKALSEEELLKIAGNVERIDVKSKTK